MKIEWPPGSGSTVDYAPAELAYVRSFIVQHETGELDAAALARQLGHLHDLKVCFGVVLAEPQALSLPDPGANDIGRFHGADSGAPETERGAAILTHPRSGTDRRRVLDLLAERGEQGATDEEISLALDLRLYTAAPRRHELLSGEWLVDSGERRPTTTGTPAAVWVLSARGRVEWQLLEREPVAS